MNKSDNRAAVWLANGREWVGDELGQCRCNGVTVQRANGLGMGGG